MRLIACIIFALVMFAAMFAAIVCFVTGAIQVASGGQDGISNILLGCMSVLVGCLAGCLAGGFAGETADNNDGGGTNA